MSLRYDLSKVEGWRDFPEAESEMMVFATMAVGMGTITEENVQRFFNRLSAWERLHGAFLMKAVEGPDGKSHGEQCPFDLETVRKYIGLKTNVSEDTPAKFAQRLLRGLREEW